MIVTVEAPGYQDWEEVFEVEEVGDLEAVIKLKRVVELQG